MANRAPTRNRIVLKSIMGERYEDAPMIASGVTNILPGQLLMRTAGKIWTPGSETGTFRPHNLAGKRAERLFAKEDANQGKTILGGYPTLPYNPPGAVSGYLPGDIVAAFVGSPGDVVFARLQAGQVVTGGESLMSAGDGSLIVAENDRLLYDNVAASAAVSNTVTETLFNKSYTIPANFLQVGDVLRIRGQVIATATHSTDTLTLKLYLGGLAGTAIISSGAVDVADGDIGFFDVTIVIRTIGASGTFVATGLYSLGVPGTVTAKPFLKASSAIDTTASKVLGIGATWSVADAGNSARLDIFTVEINSQLFPIAVALDAVDNSAGDATVNSTQTTDEFCAVSLL